VLNGLLQALPRATYERLCARTPCSQLHNYFPHDESWVRKAMRLPAGEMLSTPVLCIKDQDGREQWVRGVCVEHSVAVQ
jgi:hypothetical protein